MSTRVQRGVLHVSIDLQVEPPHCPTAAIVDELFNMLSRHQISATWAVADPDIAAASDRIVGIGAGHEIAILGDATWVRRDAGRGYFARELARRVDDGRGAGIVISTLVLRAAELEGHRDLVARQGIIAVRHADQESGQAARSAALRFGLWSFPCSCVLPGESRWLPGGGGVRTARRGIDSAIRELALFQLVIDAARLAARGQRALEMLDGVLGHAARRCDQGVLEIATLGQTARALTVKNQARPSRSILRRAA